MFRRANANDREALDAMTLAGIRHWGHDRNHTEAYGAFATMLEGEDDPDQHLVFVLDEGAGPLAFYELRDRGDHVELLRMFMRTDLIGHGYGRILWEHAVAQAALMHDRMMIVSDPGATGFYEAMGATLETTMEPTPGFVLSVYSYQLDTS